MTGYTDEFLLQTANFFDGHCIDKPRSYYRFGSEPDQWFEPVKVWEIAAADITLSPTHQAAATLLGGERGLSLRFPRFKRERLDKSPEDATTSHMVAQMFHAQQKGKK